MNVLEKILEEMENESKLAHEEMRRCARGNPLQFDEVKGYARAMEYVVDTIRSHMDEIPNCEGCSRRKWYQKGFEDGKKDNDWIPVEEKLPEIGEIVETTVHSSEWIADYNSGWVLEEEKTHHAEEYNVYYGYLNSERQWVFYDNENSENICEKEFGTDRGKVYDVVTAWRSKPDPYKERK